jgi:hypothetical protein
MIVSREEFSNIFNTIKPGFGDTGSPLWEADRGIVLGCQWFVKASTIDFSCRDTYWKWCSTNLKGVTRCFSIGEEEEWWGFTNKDDIVIWTLRWV